MWNEKNIADNGFNHDNLRDIVVGNNGFENGRIISKFYGLYVGDEFSDTVADITGAEK